MTTTDDAPDTSSPLVVATRATPHVGVLRIDSPPRNAFGRAECLAFIAAFEEFTQDPDIRCLVVTGTGKSFLSGANLRHQEELTPADFEKYADSNEGLGSIMARIEAARFPVIAAINGYALGGGLEVALCCDIRLASTDARFVCAGVNVGLILSWFRLPRVVGLGRAKEMLLSGAMYGPEQAERWGLVSGLHDPADLVPAALALAERIATRAPLSVEATKECANQAFDLSTAEAMALQREKFLQMIATRDHGEALRAFIEKRPANYERR
ncbi:enoyl-CoA hydratase/isomerase family protein [Pseudonocardia sp. MH-G8]|uniref:enoyl-CoA hydratase/isomerase family protein n=1 Tax=Pseudonocardia sp. MH-G8 TaxID=1854588 RepID=UPI000BA004DB|nr:enoyl-CoA hydratase/isomerase family protein [Pseudonocardia sp. MH-G8]OZM78114.1 enoyl-CoA hydratase [Pseudonocardia sp. MH-G8]